MIQIDALLSQELAAVVQRVQRSLVVVQDGRRGVGAGIIWGRGGWIVTNQHVIAHGSAIHVTLPDGRKAPARLAAQDDEIDLALLQVEGVHAPAILVADSRGLCVGQYVMAVGHPWGERGYVTGGMISRLGAVQARDGRDPKGRLLPIICTDTRLAPGNSGGPLVNTTGAVIGVNTMIIGGDLGVAIPSHVIDQFVEAGMQVGEKQSISYRRSRIPHASPFSSDSPWERVV